MADILVTLLGLGIPGPIAYELAATGNTLNQIKRLSNDRLLHFGITPKLKEKLFSRKLIPEKTLNKLLNDSLRICCVCKGARSHAIIIHHITPWEENGDNSEGNLVVLCLHCHGEAHTHHGFSRNLTPDQIRFSKMEWVKLVREKTEDRARGMTKIQNLNYWTYWDFFNIRRIYPLIQAMGINLDSLVQSDVGKQLYEGGYISANGSLDFSQWPEDFESKGYWLAFYDGMWISQFLVNVNNCLLKNINLKTIDTRQTSQEILSNIVVGDFVLIQDAFFFKKLTNDDSGHDQAKKVHINKRDFEIGGVIDSWYCLTMSAKIRLMGKKRASVIGIVTNIDQNGSKLKIDLSILAIGHFLDPFEIEFNNRLNNR